MLWKLLADFTVLFHAIWVLALIALPFLAIRRNSLRWVHLSLLVITFGVAASGLYCPLTIMESSLRVRYNPAAPYALSFPAHYLNLLVSWDVTTLQIYGAITGWTVIWMSVYGVLWRRERKCVKA